MLIITLLRDWLMEHNMSSGLAVYAANGILIATILIISWVADIIANRIILNVLRRFIEKSKNQWDDIIFQNKVFNRLSHLAPAFLIYLSATAFPTYVSIIQRLCLSYMILVGILVADSILDATNDIYTTFEMSKRAPIKGYIQVGKIFLFIIGGILVLSTLIQQSPWILLSGMGAITAILLLVFKDSILGLVASVQLFGNNMIRLGDWIEVPQYNADGEVIDISLHTIKVQNWDKTITSIPSYSLVSDSFKNWRGMQESGGRRIKRTVFIDMTSIKFCTSEMLDRYERIHLLTDYVRVRREEILRYNHEHLVDTCEPVNGRHMTNIGTFRAYLMAYLQNNPRINQNMTLLVRQLQPTENGLPIEVYAFTNDCAWANYESIQADIFDHIFSVVPAFELRVFQSPSGHDMRDMFEDLRDQSQSKQTEAGM